MTEQQISKLKALLETSNAPENSSELDARILKQAQRPLHQTDHSVIRKTHSLLLSNSATAFSALLLTIVILFGLAEMTSVSDPTNLAANSMNPKETSVKAVKNERGSSQPKISYLEPSKRPAEFPLNSNFSDDPLKNIELPSTQQLLDNMHLASNKDRRDAEQAITLALGEINHLLQNGNLQNARLRYQQLRDGCQPCKLPQTLESLAQIDSAEMDSG